MDELKQWAVLLCTAIIISGLVLHLFPSGSVETAGRTTLSLFLLLSILMPLNHIRFDVSTELERSEILSRQWEDKLTQNTEELSYSLAKDHILKLIQARLEQRGFTVLELDVWPNKTEDKWFDVEISLPEGEQGQEVELRSLLLSEYGIKDVEIFWQEGH